MFSNDGLFLIINHHSISFIVVSNKSSVLFFSFSIQLGYSRQTKTERTELFLKNILSWSGFFTICHLSFDFYIRDLLCWYAKKKNLFPKILFYSVRITKHYISKSLSLSYFRVLLHSRLTPHG